MGNSKLLENRPVVGKITSLLRSSEHQYKFVRHLFLYERYAIKFWIKKQS